jgi:enoyl-CoA hydratase
MASVELKVTDGIGRVTFNRPEALNALNKEELFAFGKIVWELQGRKDVSVVILTGAGEKAFIAGGDIKEMANMTPLEASQFAGLGQEVLFQMEKLPQITIAAVNGFALGGGCEFAMGCDLIYASENAKFGQPEVNLGVIPGFGGTQRLLRLVGPMKAREMVLTAGMIDAKEAHRIGLVANVFPKEKLLEEVTTIAKTIQSKGPEAIRRSKSVLREGMDVDLGRACAMEREQFALCFAHPDQKEGMKAFSEKRKPNWEK